MSFASCAASKRLWHSPPLPVQPEWRRPKPAPSPQSTGAYARRRPSSASLTALAFATAAATRVRRLPAHAQSPRYGTRTPSFFKQSHRLEATLFQCLMITGGMTQLHRFSKCQVFCNLLPKFYDSLKGHPSMTTDDW